MLVVLLARARVESPIDGVVFGVAAGVASRSRPGGCSRRACGAGAVAAAELALAPVVAGAVTGLAVAYARFNPLWPMRIVIAGRRDAGGGRLVAGVRIAAAASGRGWRRSAWDGAAGAVAAALAIELVVTRRELAEEAGLGVVPEWAPEVLPRYWRRVRGDWWPRRDERRALSRLLLQLAFRKHQLRHLDDDRATLYSLEVGRLRERARRLFAPGRAPGAAGEGVE